MKKHRIASSVKLRNFGLHLVRRRLFFIVACLVSGVPAFAQQDFNSPEPGTPGLQIVNTSLPGVKFDTLTGVPSKIIADASLPANGGLSVLVSRAYFGYKWYFFTSVLSDVYYQPSQGWAVNGSPKSLVVTLPDKGPVWFKEWGGSKTSAEVLSLKSEWRVDRDWTDLAYGYETRIYQNPSGWRLICGYYNTGRTYVYSSTDADGNTTRTTENEKLTGCVMDSPDGKRYMFEGANNARLKAAFDNRIAGRVVTTVPEKIDFVEYARDELGVYSPIVLSAVKDSLGNTLTYTYERNGSSLRLKAIASSSGGEVGFSYVGDQVTATVAGGRVVYTFSKSASTPTTYKLTTVLGLDGNSVNYQYSANIQSRDAACSGATATERLTSEKSSTGLQINYDYRFVGWLAIGLSLQQGQHYRTNLSCWPALSAVSAQHAAGEAWSKWTLSYSPEAKIPSPPAVNFFGTNETTVEYPSGLKSVFTHKPRDVLKYSTSDLLLQSIKKYKASTLLEQVDLDWSQFTALTSPQSAFSCAPGCTYLYLVHGYWHNVPSKVTIKRFDSGSASGGSVWTTELQDFDSLGNAALIQETDPSGLVRYRDRTYFVDRTANILRQLKNETVR